MNTPDRPPQRQRGTAVRRVSVESLNVAAPLVGQRLGTPARRAAAMAVDLLVVALLASAGGYFLAAALLVLALQLRGALRAEGARAAAATFVAALLVVAGVYAAWDQWSQRGEPLTSRLERAEDRIEALKAAAAAVRAATAPASGASGASLPSDASSAPLSDAERLERLASLGAENVVLRSALAERRGLKERIDEWLAELGLSFGWGIVYFSLLPAWWQGQTPGKRLLKLRIVELTGRPLTPVLALKRYGGYAAGLATGGLGFLQILWEPNRQGLHDKAAHTVVLDLRPHDGSTR